MRFGLQATPGAVAIFAQGNMICKVCPILRVVPRSRPFGTIDDLKAIDAPTVVVADRDEADPGHPLAIGEAYAETIPGARLVVEEEGKSPIAWQGGQLSRVVAELAEAAS